MSHLLREVKRFKIYDIFPCVKIPANVRFIAQADINIHQAIPYLFLRFPPAIAKYSTKTNILILEIWNRMITFFPSGRIGITNTAGMDEGKEILEKIREEINLAFMIHATRGPPTPGEITAHKNFKPVILYEYLPKTNCRLCGMASCMAFAFSVLANQKKLNRCVPLTDPDSMVLRNKLESELSEFMLISLGWYS
ncbi:MAG: (Fe-S)-binding protein [Candidatus Hermodarchaeota archaeon]